MTKVSILLPTRGRPGPAAKSIASCLDMAEEPDRVEIVVRVDDNDPAVKEYEREVTSACPRAFILRGPRHGYARIFDYYQEMAVRSTGQQLVLWNDDMEWRTKGYDSLLLDAPAFSVQFPRLVTERTSDCTLPVVGRAFWEAMGYMGDNNVDVWFSHISRDTQSKVIRDDVAFQHHRFRDQTFRENKDNLGEYWKERQVKMREADVARVRESSGWSSRFAGYEGRFTPCDK